MATSEDVGTPVTAQERAGSARTPAAPTIYDVAQAAGVAASTVSRAFTRPGRVRRETAERIFAVAEEIGYRTNALARALPTGRTRMVGLVLPVLDDPFYSRIVRGAREAAGSGDLSLVVTDAYDHDSPHGERRQLERILPLMDGVLMATSRLPDEDLREVARARPVVVLNRVVEGMPSVCPDTRTGLRRALEHLAGLGHRAVTYAAGHPGSWADGHRWRILQEEAAAVGVGAERVGPFEPTALGGRLAAAAVLARPARAVVTFNDVMALGLVRELRDVGVVVPHDLSVVGIDGVLAVDDCSPSLTTVASPLWDLGHRAMEKLVRLIAEPGQDQSRPVLLPTSLVVRESTAAPPTPR